jgi:uncharacterized protein YndB with AHSA1/START domain
MKTVKYILLGLGVVFLIYLVLCTLGIDHFDVKRSITIRSTPEKVFKHISDFKQWHAWSPWERKDPNMTSTYEGAAASVGHKHLWKSASMGDGNQEIIALRPNEYVRTKLTFTDWNEPSFAEMLVRSESADATVVTWTMDGSKIAFMMRGMIFIMGGNKLIANDYDTGLSYLKEVVEKEQ